MQRARKLRGGHAQHDRWPTRDGWIFDDELLPVMAGSTRHVALARSAADCLALVTTNRGARRTISSMLTDGDGRATS